ncbi:MAG TPA: hypothetical protein VGI78_03475 [Acetobacteraceae bacterium]|jgi:hypothetical protein
MVIIKRAALMMALAAGIPTSGRIALNRPSADLAALDSVYYSALLSGRDPDAAVRKARFRTNLLVQDLGMTRSAAAADIARFMLRRGGTLCVGG